MRGFLRQILELRGFALVRYLMWLQIAKRDSEGSEDSAQRGGYKALDFRRPFFGPLTRPDVLFILGSGSSINELGTEELNQVSQHASIGINAWALHSFVPSAYGFETGQDGNEPSNETKFVSSLLRRRSVLDAKPKFLFLRTTPPATSENLVRVHPSLQQGRYMYGRANLVTRNLANLQLDLHRIVKAAARGKTPPNVLLDNGSTVVRLMFFAAMQGFRKVVLVGVDLDSRPYFWDATDYPAADPAVSRVFGRPSGLPHSTLETVNRPFPVDQVIVALSAVLSQLGMARVYVGDQSSTLADRIPVYDWHSKRDGDTTGL